MNENISTIVEKAEGDAVKLTVTVKAKEVNRHIAAAYKDAASRYRIPGFRPGKAPRPVIDNALGGKDVILGAATDSLINEAYPYAVDQANIIVVKDPELAAPELLREGEDYTFSMALDVKPVFQLSSYDPIEIEMPIEEVTKDDMDKQMDQLREYYYDFEDVDREVQEKDMVLLSLDCERDGEKDEAYCSDERIYPMGQGILSEEFEKNLLGMTVGENKKFVIEEEDEKGPLSCDVTIKKVRVKHLPDVTEEFAKKSGFKGLAEMNVAIYEAVKAQKAQILPRLKSERCMNALADRLDGDIPEAAVQEFIQELSRQFFTQLQDQGLTFDQYLANNDLTYDQFQADLLLQAQDVAKQAYALDALAEHFCFEVTKFDIAREFSAPGIEDPVALRDEWEKSGRMSILKESILRGKASDWVIENSVVTLVGEPYDIEPERATVEAAKKEEEEKAAAEEAAIEADSNSEEVLVEDAIEEVLEAEELEEAAQSPVEEAPQTEETK